MNIRKFTQAGAIAATSATLLLLATQAGAAPLAIADTPLFLTSGVKPNLIMAIDDSGSMDFELLLRGNDGAAWWRTSADSGQCSSTSGNSFTGCIADGTTDLVSAGQLNFNNGGNSSATWKKFAYLFPNGSGDNTSNRRRLADGGNDHYAIAPLPAYGWSRSSDFNAAFFNPLVTYSPWPNGGGYTFGNSTVTAARFDPVFDGAPTIDLTKDRAGTGSAVTTAACDSSLPAPDDNHYFRVFTGMTIPMNTCLRVKDAPASTPKNPPAGSRFNNWATASTDISVGVTTGTSAVPNNASVAIRYFPATFYSRSATIAGLGYSATPAAVGKAPDNSTLYRYEIKSTNFTNLAAYNTAIQNFANWFSYYRKRHQALRAGLGTAFLSLQGTRVAGFTINQSGAPGSPDVTMGDIDVAATRTALYTNFYHDWVNSGGTPNRAAVANLVRNYKRTGDGAPIAYSCQRNFGMLFTDGFSNTPDANDGITADNVDGNKGNPYQDGVSNTLADHVMSAYTSSLRPDLTQGTVAPPAACSDSSDPRLDCNRNPHMNFYAITLGTRGLQFNPDVPVDPYVSPPTWPTTFPARHPSAVDDLWHATINGRGMLLNAKSSSELSDKLGAVLRSIAESAGSAASAAGSSGSIQVDTRLFQASFISKDWSGRVDAFDVTKDGQLINQQRATVPTTRQIMTVNSTKTATPFLWASLDATRKSQLQPTDTLGSQRVSYLRGIRTDEGTNGAKFRKRSADSVLGDFVNSAPTFVGVPPFRYPDALETQKYSTFRANNMTRTHMVYAGANDGMLHAFKSVDEGSSKSIAEVFSFIPGGVFKNLFRLTDPAYTHMFYVDGTPSTGDAFVGGSWRTVLVAGLNKGGQSIYALDITDPAALTQGSTSVFKWEFDDSNDDDLGFTYSRPMIVRMANGKWAAVFGNGYSDTAVDDHVSATGNAVLYVVDLDTGAKIAKIDTGVGKSADPASTDRPNGLSTPVLIDMNGDGIVDLGYAGDLFGNLWKFDLSSTNPAEWDVAYKSGDAATPLFVAKDKNGKRQPVTSKPSVNRGLDGKGLVVLFGTGKYLEAADTNVANLSDQSFYAVFDMATGDAASDVITSRDSMTKQTITQEEYGVAYGTGANRVTANVRATSNVVLQDDTRGVYIDLVSPKGFNGEMQVSDSVIRNGHIIYTTLIPSADPCKFGGTSWLMDMNLFQLSNSPQSAFDIDGDGKLDEQVNTEYVNGIQSTSGVNSTPLIQEGENCDYAFLPGTSGGQDTRCIKPGPRSYGRQSWRQSR
ncbi:MAG: PilC/PilY family type IV pilus protein [Gammaproteobacteria bacterium]